MVPSQPWAGMILLAEGGRRWGRTAEVVSFWGRAEEVGEEVGGGGSGGGGGGGGGGDGGVGEEGAGGGPGLEASDYHSWGLMVSEIDSLIE